MFSIIKEIMNLTTQSTKIPALILVLLLRLIRLQFMFVVYLLITSFSLSPS